MEPYRTAPVLVDRALLVHVLGVLRCIGSMPSNYSEWSSCTWADAYRARREVAALLGEVTDEYGRPAHDKEQP